MKHLLIQGHSAATARYLFKKHPLCICTVHSHCYLYIMNSPLLYTVNPPTIWPFNLIHPFSKTQQAVQKHLAQDYDTKKLRHRQLADYYQYHCNDLTAITNQLARQLTLAKEGQRLVDYFRTDKRSTRVNALEKSRLLKESYFLTLRILK